jgi:hypothetical protein
VSIQKIAQRLLAASRPVRRPGCSRDRRQPPSQMGTRPARLSHESNERF